MSIQSPRIFNAVMILVFVVGLGFLATASWSDSAPSMPGAQMPSLPEVLASPVVETPAVVEAPASTEVLIQAEAPAVAPESPVAPTAPASETPGH